MISKGEKIDRREFINPFKCFVVGDPGTGKSVFASTFPEPIFVFDFDNGIMTYDTCKHDYAQYRIGIKGWLEFEKDLYEIQKMYSGLTPEDADKFPYKTIVVDSTTKMGDVAMERALQKIPQRDELEGPIWNKHYPFVKNIMEGTLRKIIDLPTNLVVIGHLKGVYDNKGILIKMEPMLTGQLSVSIPGSFAEYYCAQPPGRKNGKSFYSLRTVALGLNPGRSRLRGTQGFLAEVLPNNYTDVITDFINRYEKGIIKEENNND
jgi:hypothetical protein